MGFLDDLRKKALDVASRAYDEINQRDGGKNWNQRTAVKPGQRAQPSGFQVVGRSIAQPYNQVSGGVAEVANEVSGRGRQQRMMREQASAATVNNLQKINYQLRATNDPMQQARLKQAAVKIAGMGSQDFQRFDQRNTQIQQRTDPLKGAASIASVGVDAATFGMGTGGVQTAKLALQTGGARALGKELAKQSAKSAAMAAPSGALAPVIEKGNKATAKDMATGAVVAGAIGGALPGATYGGVTAAKATAKTAKHAGRIGYENTLKSFAEKADTVGVNPSIIPGATKQLDKERVITYAHKIANGDEVNPIVVTRGKDGSVKVLDGEHRAEAYKALDLPVPTKTLSLQQAQMAREGGYAKIPGSKGDDAAKNMEIDRLQNIVNNPGSKSIPAGDYSAAKRELYRLKKGGELAPQADQPTQYNPSRIIKKAEDDYATGKITGNKLEAIRQAEASTATATPKQGLPQAKNQQPSIKEFQKPQDAAYTSKLNTNRIDLTDEAKTRLDVETEEFIGRLSNDEVKTFAKAAGADMKNYDVARTRQKIAEQLNLRNEIATVEKQIVDARASGASNDQIASLMERSAELGRTSRTQGTDIARQLQARRIIADQLATPQQKLFRLFDEAQVDPEVYTKRMANVDMSNADEVVKAYRDLVPAKFGDWLDKYRYTNMLSSPLTHMVNITSNIGGLAGISPVEKLTAGAIDATRSALTGGERTRFASEAGAYYKGTAKAIPEAFQRFADVVSGKQMMEMPDADALKYGRLASGGVKGAADAVLSFIPKLLEASDQFGMTLAKGGERAALELRGSKGVRLPKDLNGAVEDAAKYRVFRQDLGHEGQGHLLGAIDAIPQAILTMRRSKNPAVSTIAKFTIPFVTTPVNLFKQGIEYSPAGFATMIGHGDKTGQAAKAVMGTTVMGMAAGALVTKDAITFSEPSDAKQRDAFRAEGKQPYAIKIGNKWVGYSKLHPAIAFNLASVAAAKEAFDKGAIDQSGMDKALSMFGGVMGYYRDQSFMKSVGDFTANLEMKDGGDFEAAVISTGSNWANQLVPFKSMVSWIGRQVDPTQRKTDYKADPLDQFYQNMVKDIPGLNNVVPVRENPYYKDQSIPIKNDHPFINAWSPLRITDDHGYGNTTGLNITERREMAQLPDEDRSAFRQNAINVKFAKKQEKDSSTSTTSKTSTSKTDRTTYAQNLDPKLGDSLKKFNALTTEQLEKRYNEDSTAEFRHKAAKYENDKLNGSINEVEDVKRRKELARLEVGSKVSKRSRDLYSLSKADLYNFVVNAKDGEKLSQELLAYDKALYDAGINKYLKFKTGLAPSTRTASKGGRKSLGRKKSGGGGGGSKASKGLASDAKRGDRSADIALTKSLSQRVAKAKVSGGHTSFRSQMAKQSIKAYKKPVATKVAVRRTA